MLFVPSTVGDIAKYYKNSYVKLKEFGDEFFKITKISSNAVEFVRANGDIGEIALDEDVPYDLEFTLPHKSYYQVGKRASLLCRIPARQYHRGVTPENCTILGLSAEGNFSAQTINFLNLFNFANKPAFPSITDGLRLKSMVSCAFSPRFAASANNAVWVDNVHIGSWERDAKKTILNIRPAFHLEFRRIAECNNESEFIIIKDSQA
jgi:hypothetical protein